MATKKEFYDMAFEYGYNDYEIYIAIFLKNFKFLKDIGNYGGYYISHYSWQAQEHVIECFCDETNLTVGFFEEGNKMEIYFEKRSKLLLKKRVWLNDVIEKEKIPVEARQKVSINTLNGIFNGYSEVFKAYLIPILKGEININNLNLSTYLLKK